MEAARWINSRISLVGGIYLSSGNGKILNPCNFSIKTFDPLSVSSFYPRGKVLSLDDWDNEDFFEEVFFIDREDLDIELYLPDEMELKLEAELADAFFFGWFTVICFFLLAILI